MIYAVSYFNKYICMMTWKVRFKFRVLRLCVHVRNTAAHGETATGLTAPCRLPLICVLGCKEPACLHADGAAHKPQRYPSHPFLSHGHSVGLGAFTLVTWSILRTTELGEEAHVVHGLGLFGQGTWVPRYPEYGADVECVWGP